MGGRPRNSTPKRPRAPEPTAAHASVIGAHLAELWPDAVVELDHQNAYHPARRAARVVAQRRAREDRSRSDEARPARGLDTLREPHDLARPPRVPREAARLRSLHDRTRVPERRVGRADRRGERTLESRDQGSRENQGEGQAARRKSREGQAEEAARISIQEAEGTRVTTSGSMRAVGGSTLAMPVVAVAAIVFDEYWRTLVVERGRAPGIGLWTVPGGKVEPGGKLVQAVSREVLAATGLAVAACALAAVV